MYSLQRYARFQTDREGRNECESRETYSDTRAARLLNSLGSDC